ncbi:MAG: hypothetical protein ACREN8_00085 [Candidatus Dormibacteraceae bacterium]
MHDAEAFLDTADLAADADVKATNAVHAAIAASDAICCYELNERSADGNHSAAVNLLAAVDSRLANALNRALVHKTQASYESRDISSSDAEKCIHQARTLTEAARALIRLS